MGTIIDEHRLRTMIEGSPPMVEGVRDLATQLQPSGLDVTVAAITRMEGPAILGGPYRSKKAPEVDIALNGSHYHLEPGFYNFLLNEVVNLPLDVAGLAFARSTLFRCGASLASGVWDPGFHGQGRLGVHVVNPSGLDVEENTTFAQLVFFQLDERTDGFQFNQFHSTEVPK